MVLVLVLISSTQPSFTRWTKSSTPGLLIIEEEVDVEAEVEIDVAIPPSTVLECQGRICMLASKRLIVA